MAAPATPAQVPPPPRLWRLGFGLVALLLLWLGGRGAGWFGRGEDLPVPARSGPVDPVAAPSAASPPTSTMPAAAGSAPAASPMPMLESGQVAPSAPASSTEVAAGALPGPPAPPPAAAPTALDPDRFASQLSLVTERTKRGELGSAMLSLHHLRQLELDGPQQAVLAEAAQRLEAALAAATANIVQSLGQGRALVARDALLLLRGEGEPLVVPWIQQGLQLAGCAGDPLAPAAAGPRPIARPLERGREVRFSHQGRVEQGRVVDSRSEALTVRVQRGDAVVFPTLVMVDVEPVDATAAEAVELAFAALHAGDPVLARLWSWCAQKRRSGEPSAREQQLAILLP